MLRLATTDTVQVASNVQGHNTVLKVAVRNSNGEEAKIAYKYVPTARLKHRGGKYQVEAEVRAASCLPPSPLLVQISGSGKTTSGAFVSISRYGGTSLRRFVQGSLWQQMCVKERTADACHILVCLATALEQVHAKGYIFRDLKMDNVLISGKGGLAQLVDFGLLVRRDQADFFSGLSMSEYEHCLRNSCN